MTEPMGPVGRRRRIDRYQEIVGILTDERLYELAAPGTLDRLFAGAPPAAEGADPDEDPIEKRIRRALERLGPAFIKAGQLLATRRDLISPAFLAELEKLQDDVPPIPYADITQQIEDELGAPPEELFEGFEQEPLAAASIAQVHRGTLPDGRRVVVKVQRPGVAELMAVDLDIMERQSRSAAKRFAVARDLDVPGIVARFVDALRSELDYSREARSMELIRDGFEGEEKIEIPWVDWERTSSRVLTMEELDGIPLTRPEAMDEAGVDREAFVQTIVNAYFVQIFEIGSFHSDLHQGNIFALTDGRAGFVDFGRVSTVSERDRERLIDLLSALMASDEERVTEVLIETTGAGASLDRAAFQVEVAGLIDAFTATGEDATGMGATFERMFGMVRRYGLQMPDSMAMLYITMGTLEGVATSLDPDFNFLAAARPAMEKAAPGLIKQRLERAVRRSGPRYFRLAEDLPLLLDLVLRRAGSGEFNVAVKPTDTDGVLDRLDGIADKVAWALILSAGILGTAVLLALTLGAAILVSGDDMFRGSLLALLGLVTIFAIATVAWMAISAFRRWRRS